MRFGRLDYFFGAPEDWRERAKRRASRLLIDHGSGARDYADKRIGLTPWGSFERRRWQYIRRLVDRLMASDFPIPTDNRQPAAGAGAAGAGATGAGATARETEGAM